MRIILASNSPRRRELLGLLYPGYCLAEPREIEETYPSDLLPTEIPAYLSRLKADAYQNDLKEDEVIITADTIVINNGKVLGKPRSEEEAVEMLKSLMGHEHTVITGVTLSTTESTVTFSERTEVEFANISDEEIKHYVSHYRPLDKAGAYGIQEWIGCAAIKGIRGCFYNVMGLPLHSLYEHLKSLQK